MAPLMSDPRHSTSSPVVRLAARGDGVTADGRFVAGAVPGDSVLADGTVMAGSGRALPPCQHFGDCGGCQLQHVAEPGLQQFARERILQPLQRVGIVPVEVLPVHLSPARARRRAALRATRTQGEVRLGFNARGEHRIVDLQQCPVLHPALERLLPPLRQFLGPSLREGSAIAVTLTLTDGGVDLLLGNLQARDLPRIDGLTEFAIGQGLARLSVQGADGIETLIQPGGAEMRMGDAMVTLPPGAFLQATADGEAALVAAVETVVRGGKRIADLFAGCGTFTFPLARHARVTAVEGAAAAVGALAKAAARARADVQSEHRDLFRKPLDMAELNRFDAIVIDPPRAGAQAQSAMLARSRVPVVAAVSCNPATFARDAALLAKGGYRLLRLWPVAQFRWSTHVELVAEFRRQP